MPAGIAANIITGWIMSRFKDRTEKLVVSRQEIEFDESTVKRVIFETITRGRSE